MLRRQFDQWKVRDACDRCGYNRRQKRTQQRRERLRGVAPLLRSSTFIGALFFIAVERRFARFRTLLNIALSETPLMSG
jgi:hypothetical protein